MRRLSAIVISLCCAACIVATVAYGQGPAPSPLSSAASPPRAVSPVVETPPKPHQLTPADLEAFLDALIPSQIENRNMAGAVVAAVKDGQVLVAKGYGYADVARRKPVLASETLFRPGSISKLFTATAVMQLVEQGKLDLDRDVNGYIDFAIPNTYAQPVTLRRILTHTAGFEETVKNLFIPPSTPMRPLRDYLIGSLPVRIFEPDRVPAYSNWAISLAGYIVERTTGEPFDSYVARHVLQPLRMDHSTFTQPLPDLLADKMSNGYLFARGQPLAFEIVQAAPAGALSATADDMCRFMLAFLNNGTLDGSTILRPESVAQIESRQFESDPALNAIGLVMMQYDINGYKAWGHGGDTIAFHSDLWLVPEANFGFYISYNSAAPKSGGGRGEVLHALFDRYFPATAPSGSGVDPVVAQKDAKAVAGSYQLSRRADSNLLKLLAVLGQVAVKPNGDGTITLDSSKNLRGELKRWREISPLVYHEIDGPDKLAFHRGPDGTVMQLLPQPPIVVGQRSPWYENKTTLLPVLGTSAALLVLTGLLWPVAALVRRRYQSLVLAGSADRRWFVLSRVVCLICLVWFAVLFLLSSRAGTDISLLGDAINPWLHLIHLLGWLFAAGVLVLIVGAFRAWRAPDARLWLRAHATLLSLAGIVVAWFAWHVHLLDSSVRF